MKKALLTFGFVLFACVAANSQFFVGGSFGFSSDGGSITTGSSSVDKNKKTSFDFSPKAGFVLNENFYVGAQLLFNTNKNEAADGNYSKGSSFGFSPFARYYALRMNKFSVYGQGEDRKSVV